MSTPAEQVQQLFLAAFGRPAGPIALVQFARLVEVSPNNGNAEVLASLSGTGEYQAIFAGKSPAQQVDIVYQNLFGRPADVAGSQYWAGVLSSGTAVANIVPAVAAGAQGSDLLTLQARAAAANALQAEINTFPEAQLFDTDAGHAAARSLVLSVHDQASLARVSTPFALKAVMADIEAGRAWSQPALVEDQVQQAFVAYFGRPADRQGFDFWASGLDGNSASPALAAMRSDFANSAEYRALYPQASDAEKIDSIYQHLFSRGGDSAGIAYWEGLMRAGSISLSNAVTAIAAGAQGNDAVVFNGKVEVAGAFTAALNEAREAQAYATPAALQAVTAYLAAVHDQATLQAALAPAAIQALIDSFTGPAQVVGVAEQALPYV